MRLATIRETFAGKGEKKDRFIERKGNEMVRGGRGRGRWSYVSGEREMLRANLAPD